MSRSDVWGQFLDVWGSCLDGPKIDSKCPKMGHELPNPERSLVVIDIVRLLLANAAGSVLLDTLCTLARRQMGRAAGNLF